LNTQVKVVILDQGGVLTWGGVPGTNGVAAAQIMGLSDPVVVPRLDEALKRGQISNAEFIAGINRLHPHAPNKLTDEMWDLVYSWMTPCKQAYKLVKKCRTSGRKVGLLSNINPAMAVRLRDGHSYDGFDLVVLSCEAGYAKPDLEIYELVEAGLPPSIRPEEILFLDDQQKCLDGAKVRGWQTMLVTDPDQMVQEVTELLNLV